MLKFCFGKVGEITTKLREFLKSDTQNTFEIYKDQGRLVVDMASQNTASGLVPAEAIDQGSAVDQSEESEEIMRISESNKKNFLDLQELKKALEMDR